MPKDLANRNLLNSQKRTNKINLMKMEPNLAINFFFFFRKIEIANVLCHTVVTHEKFLR